jgi:hypothetical protein
MNELELVLFICTIAGLGSSVLIGISWIIRNILRSKTGKVIDRAKAQHKPLVLAASLGHHAKLMRASEVFPGMLETAKFAKRTGKTRKVFATPKYTEVELTDVEIADEKSRELTQECLDGMLQLNTEKVFLEDGVPVTLALDDKVVTTGVKGIGALAFYEKLLKIDKIKDKIAELKNNSAFKDVGEYLEGLAAKISIINIEVLRNYFDSDWDQADAESQSEYYYVQGYRDGQKKEKGVEKMFIIGGIAIGIVGCVMGALLAFIG